MKRVIGLVAAVWFVVVGVSNSSAGPIRYFAFLDGPSEATPNNSPGKGFATFAFDPVAHTLALDVTYSGLLGNTTAAHIHGPTALPGTGAAGVVTTVPFFVGFPVGDTSGTYSTVLDTLNTTTYNPAFLTAMGGSITAAEAALGAMLANGRAYLNIHSTTFPPGEIRGFILPVPEPSSLVIWGIGVLGMFGYARAKSRRRIVSAA